MVGDLTLGDLTLGDLTLGFLIAKVTHPAQRARF